MKLNLNEFVSVLIFCSNDILQNIFKKYKVLEFTSTILANNIIFAQSLLKVREEKYTLLNYHTSMENLLIDVIDIDGFDDGYKYKNDIFYDGRLESIFTIKKINKKIMLPKKIGKIWLDKSYEYYASISISKMISYIILPWIHNKYYNFMNLTLLEYLYIDLIFNTISDKYNTLSHKKISKILQYIYTLIDYLRDIKGKQISLKDKKKIRKIANFIKFEKSNVYPLYVLLSHLYLDY